MPTVARINKLIEIINVLQIMLNITYAQPLLLYVFMQKILILMADKRRLNILTYSEHGLALPLCLSCNQLRLGIETQLH